MDTAEETRAPEVPLQTDGSLAAAEVQQQAPSNDAPPQDHSTANDAPANGNADGAEEAAAGAAGAADATAITPGTPMSKNAQKKLKRQQKWEDMRDDRKRRRKEKRIVKQEKKRAAKSEAGEGQDDAAAVPAAPKEHVLVPVSLIFDCDFESFMRETEQISLASQITRSYAANRTATRCAHIYVSSWGGKLQTRYETLLSNQHKRWNHVKFVAEDFVGAAQQADTDMRGEQGGTVVGVLGDNVEGAAVEGDTAESEAKTAGDGPNVVYLTSDSPNTLTRLEPYTSYVIGGIVDKNREKGLCYGRAQTRGIRTAKLPIGDYMVMASRQVLTTNHVVEIMLSWLETGDWATAFTNVIPKRKGGHLKGDEGDKEGEAEGDKEGEAEGDKEDEGDEEDGAAKDPKKSDAGDADDSAMDLQDDVNTAQLQAKSETIVSESIA